MKKFAFLSFLTLLTFTDVFAETNFTEPQCYLFQQRGREHNILYFKTASFAPLSNLEGIKGDTFEIVNGKINYTRYSQQSGNRYKPTNHTQELLPKDRDQNTIKFITNGPLNGGPSDVYSPDQRLISYVTIRCYTPSYLNGLEKGVYCSGQQGFYSGRAYSGYATRELSFRRYKELKEAFNYLERDSHDRNIYEFLTCIKVD